MACFTSYEEEEFLNISLGGGKTVQWHKKEKKTFKFNDFILWMSKSSDQQTNTAISRTTLLLWSANSLYVRIQHATSMSCLKMWLVTVLPQLPYFCTLLHRNISSSMGGGHAGLPGCSRTKSKPVLQQFHNISDWDLVMGTPAKSDLGKRGKQ